MNEILAPLWEEQMARLRLGIAPVDAIGSRQPLIGLSALSEDVPVPHPLPPAHGAVPDPSIGLPGLRRSPSGRFSVLFTRPDPQHDPRLVVRIVDPRQRFVARRLSIPAPTLTNVTDADAAHAGNPAAPLRRRACRPVMFPGATYGAPAGATVLRGRATWGAGGPPVQWARIEAGIAGTQQVRWRAHGDAHGEFLLFVGPLTTVLAMQKTRTVDLDVTVHGRPEPAPPAPVDSPAESRDDPLWHLPIETVGSLAPGDVVARGVAVPADYTASTTRLVQCRRGGIKRVPQIILN